MPVGTPPTFNPAKFNISLGAAGTVLTSTGTTTAPTFQAAAGGTPATPAGAVQFNSTPAGTFTGDADFTWVPASNTLNAGSSGTPGIVIASTFRGINGAGQGASLRAGTNTAGGGGAVNIVASPAVGNGNGGAVNITAGAADINGNGGSISVVCGDSPPGDGGSYNVQAGSSIGTGNGGVVVIAAGNGGFGGGNGGDFTAAAGNDLSGGAMGGNLFLNAGAGATNGYISLGVSGTEAIRITGPTMTGTQTATFVSTNKPGTGAASPIAWLPVKTAAGADGFIPVFGA